MQTWDQLESLLNSPRLQMAPILTRVYQKNVTAGQKS